MGRGITESYAERFRDIWNKGVRKNKQTLTTDNIYEIVMAKPRTYEIAIDFLGLLIKEHKERDNGDYQ